ncbi:MAG: hypothetical protein ACRC0L_06225, partial [Angustibacter sp.]
MSEHDGSAAEKPASVAAGSGEDERLARESERGELTRLAADTALDARAFLEATTTVASGTSPDVALPIILLAISQVLVTGGRLGA